MTRLSVVVTVVDGRGALERCLTALAQQEGKPDLEIIVPYDATVTGVPDLAARFPGVNFLALGTVPTEKPWDGPEGQHELFDRRRAAGLKAATGDLVAILEDRGVPRVTWARAMLALHERQQDLVIGGAIENGKDALLNRAVYACDFGRYQLPFEAGPREYVSDVNICYKRRALEETRELWQERYHETTVHWALMRAGHRLLLSPEPIVDQMREGLTLSRALQERIGWGRLFAFTRAREVSLGRRLLMAAVTPLLPAILFLRHLRVYLAKGHPALPFLAASPAIVLLLVAWSVGEFLGYVSGKA